MILQLPQDVRLILNAFSQSGFAAYVVGGCVRDSLRGVSAQDWDICTAATPAEMRRVFADETLVSTGETHGTLTLVRHAIPYEITTFRADGTYLDARHPSSVRFGVSLAEDLARRDFTVNAMAYAPKTGLVDLYGGQADLQANCLRCVGDAQVRFAEDALRILRAARFAATLCFAIEPKTAQAALQAAPQLSHVTAERVGAEMKKLLCGKNAGAVLRQYKPLFEVLFTKNLNENTHEFEMAAQAISAAPPLLSVRLALLCTAVGTKALCALRLDGKTVRQTTMIAENLHTEFAATKFAARTAMSVYGAQLPQILQAQTALAIACHDGNKQEKINAFSQLVREQTAANASVTQAQLCVSGADALAQGVRGRAVGLALQAALQTVLHDETQNTRAALLPLLAGFATLEKQDEK